MKVLGVSLHREQDYWYSQELLLECRLRENPSGVWSCSGGEVTGATPEQVVLQYWYLVVRHQQGFRDQVGLAERLLRNHLVGRANGRELLGFQYYCRYGCWYAAEPAAVPLPFLVQWPDGYYAVDTSSNQPVYLRARHPTAEQACLAYWSEELQGVRIRERQIASGLDQLVCQHRQIRQRAYRLASCLEGP